MRRTIVSIASVAALLLVVGGLSTVASAGGGWSDDGNSNDGGSKKSAFALFDATNPANVTTGKSGVLCGVSNSLRTALAPGQSFTYNFAVTNDGSGPLECKVIYTDTDFVRYKIPLGTSFSISQAAGSGVNDAAVRLSCDNNLSGAGSVQGPRNVFCISCDGVTGQAFCNSIIPN